MTVPTVADGTEPAAPDGDGGQVGANVTGQLLLTALWIGVGVLLFWLATVLGPDVVEATDGWQRILFTIVPIPIFARVMGAVFVGLGLVHFRKAITARRERAALAPAAEQAASLSTPSDDA